jgi:VanZ family protein
VQNYKKNSTFASKLEAKVTKYIQMIKKYPISWLLIATIWVLCFIDVPETPLDNVSLIDKWVHIAMYGGTSSVIWLEYLFKHHRLSPRKLLVFAVIAPILMSGVIELLQAYFTGGRRSGDWMDFAANSIGVILGAGVGILLAWWRAKAGKASV